MYRDGRGVPQSDAQAVEWYRKAAEQGMARAQLNLGIMYAEGQGVLEDYVRAYAWSNLAAAQGDQNAAKVRGLLRETMTAARLAQAQKLSVELLRRIEERAED